MTRLTGSALRVTALVGENDTRLLSLSEDPPVAVVIVDTEERVRALLPRLDELVTEGPVILDDCEVVRYAGREKAPGGPGGTDPRGRKSS
ncbi:DUF190 domain-containing protein [Streptomyces flaveolus]|uniref:DUF190 domain-containing protein n=1 Tax=Streptomyces flaveolus TaxID=67297 RepID=UPI00331F30C0